MKPSLLLIIVLFFTQIGFSQELQATFSINYQQVNNGNPQLFKNLEKQVYNCGISQPINEHDKNLKRDLTTTEILVKSSNIRLYLKIKY